MISFAAESPLGEDLALLFERHRADMYAQTPASSVHMLRPESLTPPEVLFFTLREEGVPLAMGALKRLGGAGEAGALHGEIKSMHVLAEHRGRGLARLLLEKMLAAARAKGFARLSLETGVEPIFAPARALYARAGFAPCAPFGDYWEDPNSLFMTKSLAEPGALAQ